MVNYFENRYIRNDLEMVTNPVNATYELYICECVFKSCFCMQFH